MASFTGFLKLGFYRINYFSSAKLLARTLDLYPLIFLIVYFSYFLVSNYLTNGRTISYIVLNLYAVPKTQREFDIKTCFLRASAYTIPIGLFGINPLLGVAAYFFFYKPLKFFGLNSPLIDVISDCHVYEFKNEEVHHSISEDIHGSTVLLSQSTSQVIELDYHQEAEVIDLTEHQLPSEQEKEAA